MKQNCQTSFVEAVKNNHYLYNSAVKEDLIEYGRVTQDSYVNESFALNNNLLIHCNHIPK